MSLRMAVERSQGICLLQVLREREEVANPTFRLQALLDI
jgi:hypothetical protein